jgi:hypothetical protein
MKKTIFAAVGTIILLMAIYAGTPPKEFTLKLTDAQLNQLWYVIENSAASHVQVKEIQDIIQGQVQKQMADTTNKK